MSKLTTYIGASLMGLGLLAAPQAAVASSHREAPAIALDPAADNTDLWAWSSKAHDKLYVVAAYNPLEEPAGGPNFHKFADEVLYEIHITSGTGNTDKLTYQFRFRTTPIGRVDVANTTAAPGGGKEFFAQLSGQKQTYSLVKLTYGDTPDIQVLANDVPVAPINYGPRTYGGFQKGTGDPATYNDQFAAKFITNLSNGEGRVWAGPRDDGFYVDLGGIFDLANLRAAGTAQDGVAHYNCHAIVLEIPANLLTADGQAPGNTPSDRSTVGVWASASRRQVQVLFRDGTNANVGPWVQVSRQGLPLINEAVIGLQDKDKYNRTRPYTDVQNFGGYFLNPIIVRDAEAVGIYAALGPDPTPFKYNRADILDVINLKNIPAANSHNVTGIGDLLRVDMATNSSFPNGRPLGTYDGTFTNKENDVTDILLSVLLTKKTSGISDGVNHNDATYLNDVPFLALPWRGFDQGHGVPAP